MLSPSFPLGANVSQDEEPQRGRGRNKQLSVGLSIPKNRSTGNLAAVSEEEPLNSRSRHSIDAGAALLDYDSLRCVTQARMSLQHHLPSLAFAPSQPPVDRRF